jgi:SpoVK/Ycf46/Vps4 family AAA+-type ATPase
LSSEVADAVEQLLAERQVTTKLAEVGLEPSRTLLLVGPPGVGKTLTAAYVAARLRLPLKTIDLAAVMSSYLGRTGRNLRDALDDARQENSVAFLDEFDALAKRRDDDADIGELKRLVNVLLQQLDRWPSNSLLIAATNHPELLDHAVTRRFDITLELRLPTTAERSELLRRMSLLQRSDIPEDVIDLLALATEGHTHAAVEQWVTNVGRRAIVTGVTVTELSKLFTEHAIERLRERASSDPSIRQVLAGAAHHELGLSLRKVATLLGYSHPTVSKDVAAFVSKRSSVGRNKTGAAVGERSWPGAETDRRADGFSSVENSCRRSSIEPGVVEQNFILTLSRRLN